MSIDLTAAIEAGQPAALDAFFRLRWHESWWINAEEMATKVVSAAAPLIEAAVREQIARDIEAEKGDPEFDPGLVLAADVARGEQP